MRIYYDVRYFVNCNSQVVIVEYFLSHMPWCYIKYEVLLVVVVAWYCIGNKPYLYRWSLNTPYPL